MLKLSQITGFDWDKGNIAKNWHKHSVSYKECEQIFFNQPLLMHIDPKHSEREKRLHALGKTNANRLIFISFTVRGDKIRIISARDMNKNERKKYEQ